MEQLEGVLEHWVNEELFNCQPAQAQQLLTEVLTKVRCSNKVVHIINSKMVKHTDGGDKMDKRRENFIEYQILFCFYFRNQETAVVVKEELMGDMKKQLEAIQKGMLTRDEIEKIRPTGFE